MGVASVEKIMKALILEVNRNFTKLLEVNNFKRKEKITVKIKKVR